MYVYAFFFQAEDGIRDAQESRGLGDVYKRQPLNVTVVGADTSSAMIAAAQQHAAEGLDDEHAARLEWVLGSGAGDEGYDLVLSSMVFMYINLDQMLPEIVGLLNPGGQLVVATWGKQHEVPWLAMMKKPLTHPDPGSLREWDPPPFDPADPCFKFGDPDPLTATLAAQPGLVAVEATRREFEMVFESSRSLVSWCCPEAGARQDALVEVCTRLCGSGGFVHAHDQHGELRFTVGVWFHTCTLLGAALPEGM
eukprot:TRINITY_DN22313_c0_g1_i2.p1 TRINITY_DN22313_c0_g1~~TRINITY_DN22313_c0_g1_i2.p1  ORF type:complete len:252 (+),score=63.35 TRINITY_DN22313_c0_g1_i2:48-803(+)